MQSNKLHIHIRLSTTTELNFVHKFYSVKIDISGFRSNTFDQIPRWFF